MWIGQTYIGLIRRRALSRNDGVDDYSSSHGYVIMNAWLEALCVFLPAGRVVEIIVWLQASFAAGWKGCSRCVDAFTHPRVFVAFCIDELGPY